MISPESPQRQTQSPEAQKLRFKYYIKHQPKLNSNNLRPQIVKRFHFSKIDFEGEGDEENDIHLNEKMQKELAKVNKFNKRAKSFHQRYTAYDEKVTINGLSWITESLKTQSSLENLNFNLFDKQTPSDESFYLISQLIKRAASLKTFKFTSNRSRFLPISNSGIKYLTKALQTVASLKDLQLTFYLFKQFTEQTAQNLSRVFKKQKNSLETLHLDFQEVSSMKDQEIQTLTQGIESLASLKNLNLDFYCDNGDITEKGRKSLIQTLSKLTTLQAINLVFHFDQTDDAGLLDLSEALKNLLSLEKFAIRFQEAFQVTESGCKSLNQSFKNLPILKSINVEFRSCDPITAEAFESLFEGLEAINYFKDLGFSFNHCKQINDSSVEKISTILTKYTNLETLDLSFMGCWKVSDKGLQSLGQGLKELSLQKLALDFHYCWKITNEGVKLLIEGLQTMNSLKEIDIRFEGCHKIEKEMISLAQEKLNKISSIQNVVVNWKPREEEE